MVWGFVSLVIGFIYGWAAPGKQDKAQIFKTGLLWGLIIALVLALIGFLVNANPLGFGSNLIGLAISFVFIVALFVLGVWLGDLVEGAQKKRKTA